MNFVNEIINVKKQFHLKVHVIAAEVFSVISHDLHKEMNFGQKYRWSNVTFSKPV